MTQDQQFSIDRMKGLGGSDFPKLLISGYQYGGPYDVFLEKTEGSTFTGNNATQRGHYMEPCVAQWYADATGRKLHKVSPETDPTLKLAKVGKEWTLVHPEFPFLRGTPDFLTDDADLGLEVKTAKERQQYDTDNDGNPLWGYDGSDLVPLAYMIQCQWYMGLTGRRRWDLAVFFIGDKDEFRCYHLEFDPEFFAQMVEAGVEFWQTYVEAGTAPPMDLIPSNLVRSHLLTKAIDKGLDLKATPDLELLGMAFAQAQAAKKDAEDDEEEIKGQWAHAMAVLGAHKVKGKTPDGKAWSVAAQGGTTGTKANNMAISAIFYRMLIERGASEEELEGIIAANTIPTSTEPYVRGYFNSVNKDRKANRASAKAAYTIEEKAS